MNNFTFHNPTRLLFGKGMIEKLSTAIPMVHRIMITFGGGSVKQNGVYDQVIKTISSSGASSLIPPSRPCEKLSR